MRVCFVTDTFPPDVNGVANTLLRLRDLLEARGDVVDVVVPGDLRESAIGRGALPPDQPASALKLPALPLPGYPGLRFGLPARSPLRKFWRRHRPDIIYVATESPLGYSATEAAGDLSIPVVSGYHTNFDEYMRDYRFPVLKDLAGGYLRALHNRTAATFAPTPDLVERLRQQGYHDVRRLGRGVDTGMFRPERRSEAIRASWGADGATTVALLVGRVAPEKNLPLAGHAFGHMARHARGSGRRFQAVVIGDGPERAKLEKNWPDVIFDGTHSGTDLAERYASADVFVFPSVTETFGNVVLEAMASGLVVVAFAMAAAGLYIRHRENGLLAPPGDDGGFLDACTEAQDPVRQPVWRRAARESALGLSWEQVVDSFQRDLRELARTA